ncbi:ring finger domain protein [Lentinula edodes]|uniref:Ring finger domain protein n=1 Tax=Lentinula edodes TaxID=5353 RepID=A0A1Q3E2R3_LENED|nr:ring finger domain protein [Lentinula edodes]
MTTVKGYSSGNRSSKSSGSASVRQSTSSYDSDMITDSGQRLRSNVTIAAFQRPNGSRPTTPAAPNLQKKDKGKERQSKSHGSTDASFSGPIAVAEFERMRIEIETLKSTLNDHKKNARKQAKKIDELKAEIVTGKATRDEQEAQLQLLKSKHSRNEELLNTFETTLTCNICMELLNKPFSLSPCGHTFCLQDLQEWFRKAPPADEDMDLDIDDPDYVMYRQKSCPACRAVVLGRPLPVYPVRDLISALQKAKVSGNAAATVSTRRSSSPYVSEDPWEGLFPDNDEDEEDEEEDGLEVGAMPFGFLYSESDSEMEMHDDDSEYDSNGEPEEEEDNSAIDEEEEGESGEDVEGEGYSEGDEDYYVSPQWEPPCYPYPGNVAPGPQSQLVRRGCPPWLSSTYRIRYSHNNGLVGHLNSLDPDDVGAPPRGPTSRMHRLFLGWNIRNIDDQSSELSQRFFMAQILEDFRNEPYKFSIHQRANGCLDVRVLVPADEVTQYYSTESEGWD